MLDRLLNRFTRSNSTRHIKSKRRPPTRRRFGFESLEDRSLLSVSNLNITALTSAADTDLGAGGAEHVAVVAGSTVTVQFSYTSTAANETTAKFDINTSPATVSTTFTTVTSGSGQTASLSVVIPA